METKFKIGDLVKITNQGKLYPNYIEWVEYNASKYAPFFKFDCHTIKNKEDTYKIVVIAPHDTHRERTLCLVQSQSNSSCYLIEDDGIELVSEPDNDKGDIVCVFISSDGIEGAFTINLSDLLSDDNDPDEEESSTSNTVIKTSFWEKSLSSDLWRCHNCGRAAVYQQTCEGIPYRFENFCPHCGCEMKKVDEVCK